MDISERLLAGDADAIGKLADSNLETWRVLLEHLVEHKPEAAPAPLVAAMLDRASEFHFWNDRAKDAAGSIESQWFSTARGAMRYFRPWWVRGILRVRSERDPIALAARYEWLVADPNVTDLQGTTMLARDVAAALPGTRLEVETWSLVARRALEERAYAVARDAAQSAEDCARTITESRLLNHARRQRACALLHLKDFDAGFGLLDEAMRTTGLPLGGGGAHVNVSSDDPRIAALDELTAVAQWATVTTPEWVRALGGLAERHLDSSLGPSPHGDALWARFDHALKRLRDESETPHDALDVVAEQAAQRKLRRTAKAARSATRR